MCFCFLLPPSFLPVRAFLTGRLGVKAGPLHPPASERKMDQNLNPSLPLHAFLSLPHPPLHAFPVGAFLACAGEQRGACPSLGSLSEYLEGSVWTEVLAREPSTSLVVSGKVRLVTILLKRPTGGLFFPTRFSWHAFQQPGRPIRKWTWPTCLCIDADGSMRAQWRSSFSILTRSPRLPAVNRF